MDLVWRGWVMGAVVVLASGFGACLGATAIGPQTNEPQRVFTALDRTVLVDAGTRTVMFDGAELAGASRVVGAVEMRGYLFVAQRDGVVLVYELPSPATDGVPTLVQRIENLGRDIRAIVVSEETERVMLLAAGTTEIFGINVFEQEVIDDGTVEDPAYFDHARYLEFIRDEDGQPDDARAMAVSPTALALATDRELLDLFYLNRSYAVTSRSPLPDGVTRVDAIVHDGTRWILAGLSDAAEPVLMVADALDGAWADLGLMVVDHALKGKDGPIAWLPGGFAVEDGRVHLAIKGERGAVVSWPVGMEELTNAAVEVRWLGSAEGRGG